MHCISQRIISGLIHNNMCVLGTLSCLTLCNPMDSSPPGFSIHGIFQARTLESVAIPFSRGYSWSPWATFYDCIHSQSLQSCPTLHNPMDSSPPGSSVHRILQARILEWVAMLSSRGSFWPRDRTCVSYIYPHWQAGSLPLAPPGKPQLFMFIPFYFLFYILHIL